MGYRIRKTTIEGMQYACGVSMGLLYMLMGSGENTNLGCELISSELIFNNFNCGCGESISSMHIELGFSYMHSPSRCFMALP